MLDAALHELQQVWETVDAPIAAYLAPGLPRAAADSFAAQYGLVLPDDVADYFGWHDGLRTDRDQDIEMLPALRPLSLEESLDLQAALKDAFSVLPDLDPVLAGRWLPLFADDAGNFLLVSVEPGAEGFVYALELEEPGKPSVRFKSLTILALALTELFRSGIYVFAEGTVNATDPVAAEAIILDHNGNDGGESTGADNRATDAGVDAAAVDSLAVSLAASEGSKRAITILDAVDELGLGTVTAAIDSLDIGARDEVARSLGATENQRAAPVLLHLLADTEDFVRETAVAAIGFTGEPAAAEALLPLLTSSNHNLRKTAAFSLGELRIDAAAESVLALTGDANPLVRTAAATALGKIGHRVDIEPILQLLHDPYPDAAQMAAWALGEIGDPAAAPALQQAAASEDATLARIASAALQQLQRAN